MPYDPTLYMPYRGYQTGPGAPISQPSWYYQPPSTTAQPVDGLVSVTGIEGARAYQLPPNSKMALFDADSDVFYVKTTDAGGFPTVRSFSFTPIEQVAPMPPIADYVPRSEFDKLARVVDDLMSNLGIKEEHDGE